PIRHIIAASAFLFSHTPTHHISALSLHAALPIYHGHADERRRGADPRRGRARAGLRRVGRRREAAGPARLAGRGERASAGGARGDRKSTRLNSSHVKISYAVFCLKKKTSTRKHQY